MCCGVVVLCVCVCVCHSPTGCVCLLVLLRLATDATSPWGAGNASRPNGVLNKNIAYEVRVVRNVCTVCGGAYLVDWSRLVTHVVCCVTWAW